MNLATFFTGMAGFDLAFERAGVEVVLNSEIEDDCQKVLSKHYPGCVSIGDILAILAVLQRIKKKKERYDHWEPAIERLRAAAIFVGGFPCQDLSVAGRRVGLAGERSGLWFAFRRAIAKFRPPWVVIENVPGLLSSNGGRDLAIILSGLEKLGYWWAYRVLDAQYFGVAQRRERVFIVASFGNARCAEVLFERESMCWDTPPRRSAGQRVTPPVAGCSNGGGANGPGRTADYAETLVVSAPEVSRPIVASSGGAGVDREDKHTLIAQCFTEGMGENWKSAQVTGVPAHEAKEPHTLVTSFSSKDSGDDALVDLAPTLRAMNNEKGFGVSQSESHCVRRLTPT